MSKLLILDGNAILHRAYHAIPDLTNKKGEHTNAVYGFISMLLNLINNFKPTHLAVCFDEKEKTFRKKDFKAYQAKRPKMDPWLASQIIMTRDFLDVTKISWYSKSGYEADDVIGTICAEIQKSKFKSQKMEAVIVTGDRDIFQLINEKVKVYTPTRGLSGKLWDVEEVKNEFDFAPIQMIDYKALVGDSSDNYPGVNGIGPKTARDLIIKYRTIENIYKHLSEIPEKIREKLEKGEKDALFFHKIATIFNEVPIKFELDKANKGNWLSSEATAFYQKMGFKSLVARIEREFGNKGEEKEKSDQNQLSLI